jgi:hypothetical protein
MNIQPLVDSLKAGLELELEKQINDHCDEAVHAMLEEIKKVIPGNWEDAPIAAIEPKLKEVAKAKLLGLVEPISDKV